MSLAPPVSRDLLTAAAETVALVLEENSPLPETSDDVETLAARLRGHISQLSVVLPAGDPAVTRARKLGSAAVPDGYVSSRVHLVHLAEATQGLIVAARERDPFERLPSLRPRRPSRDSVRVLVFVLALVTLVVAASVPCTG
ncbi:DUF6415 family natural product biosynthesis protein [Streptomyces sp. Go40/10]|uniref:DUF6415 family natural product biosynthesis protein n=1 Tax=Streptomyces sp. Go40/10 TaxID=2825844 RepID=UPI001E509848|nr:DUF6415 family natural product biosynthesis protein [Streptomyces sp. Go40/10]UFQ99778.1 DUF6415 family natural product biosynthesis protein [Streptomyces sp. Go40/10]